jgi:ATP-dependent DNA helicase RecG
MSSCAGRAAVQDAVVAFSNADGGVMLIGVDDAETIRGRELSPSALDDIHQAIREARDPGRYSVHELNVDGRPVIVIAVARRGKVSRKHRAAAFSSGGER